jgi:Ser/Thr protein kinase RdoA (MazF antagonist)
VGHIYYCLFPRKGGRAPDELGDDEVARLGMMAARMHNVGAKSDAKTRIRLNSQTYVHDNLAFMKDNQVIPERFETRYFDAARAIAEITDDYLEGVAIHRIHGDFHLGNLLLREERFYVLDFDDMVVGPAVQDMWLLIPGRGREVRRQQEIWADAYQQFRDFDRQSLRLVEPLRGLRFIHYATWLARRWHDPAFPATWPHFGTDDYWEQETADLEEQLHICRRSDPHAEPGEIDDEGEEEEVSNKDLFWDWEE